MSDVTGVELQMKYKKGKKILWLAEKEVKFEKQNALRKYINNLISVDGEADVNTKNEMLSELNKIFDNENDKLKNYEIPEYMCCKITFVNILNYFCILN